MLFVDMGRQPAWFLNGFGDDQIFERAYTRYHCLHGEIMAQLIVHRVKAFTTNFQLPHPVTASSVLNERHI